MGAGAACSVEELDLGGEVDSVNVVKTELCVKTVRANKEKIVWVNVRLDRNISNNGENERFVLRQALVAGDRRTQLAGAPHTTSLVIFNRTKVNTLHPRQMMSGNDVWGIITIRTQIGSKYQRLVGAL